MAYSTDDDFLKEISQSDLARLTGDNTAQNVDYGRITYARMNADAVIDSYLVGRFKTPLSEPVDGIIKKLSLDLTVANLFEYSYFKTAIPNTIVWRRINALKMLKDLQSGVMSIQAAIPGTTASPGIRSNKSESDRIYNSSVWKKYKFDD